MKPTERFSSRAGHYSKFRPSYPDALLDFMEHNFPFHADTKMADIGSGTGILTELLLQKGYTVTAIEPNAAMRIEAERRLASMPGFKSVKATAEHTTLPDRSVNVITIAQAFHWFDAVKTKEELNRILIPGGHIAIIWNLLDESSPFVEAYEAIKVKYGRDYLAIRKSHEPDLRSFFLPAQVRMVSFPYNMFIDLDGVKGLIMSSSFMPMQDDAVYPDMMRELENVFNTFQENGLVNMQYHTMLHYNP